MTVPVQDRTATKPARVGRRVPAKTGDRSVARSGAAQRAYAKRNQRAAVSESTPKSARSGFTARIPFVAAVIGLLSVGLAVTLLLTTRAAEDSYKLSAAKAHNQELIEKKAALERDFRAANSAPELARKAAELGMIAATDVARLVVADDGSVTVVGEPKPATGAPVVAPAPAAAAAPSATGPARGAGVTAADLPPVGTRATADLAPIPARAPAAVAAAPAPLPAPAAPAPEAATPQAANSQQPAAQDEQLVPMARGAQASADTGTGGAADTGGAR
ncbi:hypothetical protein [Rhodococcus gannanensis]|uniref:Cell division protein FtsL n=1 Tax=Rhodococcus gannanensis TaxID=1960308 RepID=A0ABW4P4W6_9NOCA